MSSGMNAIERIQNEVTRCELCPRLRKHCLAIAKEKRKSFADQIYWGKPVPAWGDPNARLVIIGLAPAAHGANRTGRMFTGDRSGDWLYRALHKQGFANQSHCTSREDGLELLDTYITASARCAPPDNKPTPEEIQKCSRYLTQELAVLKDAKVYLALGDIAYRTIWDLLSSGLGSSLSKKIPRPKFRHGLHVPLENKKHLLLSYHPSQQNTFTGRLTEPMFDSVFAQARSLIVDSFT